MPAAVKAELSFSNRMQLRERILAFISRDVGLSEFLIPDLLADSWTAEERQAWTNRILDNFLHATSMDGKIARRRILACETASGLRRSCMKLRQRTATYRDIAKTSVSLESLWNDVSTELDDEKWARCMLLFDSALVSLRVAYVWMYLRAEATGPNVSLETKRALFETLVRSFFISEAPTDDKEDKHSTNFRDLLGAWQDQLQTFEKSEDFDAKLRRLEETQGLDITADNIQRFLDGVDIDNSWVLNMQKLEKDVQRGELMRSDRKVGRPKGAKGKVSKAPKSTALPTGEGGGHFKPVPPESVSSFEPATPDSDFDIEAVDDAGAEDDDDSGDEDDDSQEVAEIVPTRSSPRNPLRAGLPPRRVPYNEYMMRSPHARQENVQQQDDDSFEQDTAPRPNREVSNRKAKPLQRAPARQGYRSERVGARRSYPSDAQRPERRVGVAAVPERTRASEAIRIARSGARRSVPAKRSAAQMSEIREEGRVGLRKRSAIESREGRRQRMQAALEEEESQVQSLEPQRRRSLRNAK